MGKLKKHTFRGGYRFRNFQGEPDSVLETISLPDQVILALKQSFGSAVPPLVKRGDTVRAGEIIGEDPDSLSNPVLSSVNGTVDRIKTITLNGEKVSSIFIKSTGTSEVQAVHGASNEWQNLALEDIETVLYQAGAARLGSRGIPTHHNSSPAQGEIITSIIVHFCSDDLYNPDLSLLLGENGLDNLCSGIAILQKLFPDSNVHFVCTQTEKELQYQLQQRLSGRVSFYSVKQKYPQGMNEMLMSAVNSGVGNDISGTLLFSVQDVIQICTAVVEGVPVINKTVALAGTGFSCTPHVRVRIGTEISHIVNDIGNSGDECRYIENSTIRGATLSSNTPVTSGMDMLIALPEQRTADLFSFTRSGIRKDSYSNTFLSRFLPFKKKCDTNARGDRRACLSCSYCSDTCPSQIMPNILHPYIEREKITETPVSFGIFDCIECNLCTYVCPAKIPLAAILKKGKALLRSEGFTPSDRERER